ncbi:MAG: hypothetical protein NZ959_04540 [Armatimonadetes bacterium]|nr:hypothetical protein [Armatimonadota bacterium]MDW8121832.1 hypothetical protein [Armatimonadota bacterium]
MRVFYILLLVGFVVVFSIALYLRWRSRRKNKVMVEDPFTIPPFERRIRALQTLEELLEETDDPVIRDALEEQIRRLREKNPSKEDIKR